jgi:glycosyltransferase involved in cell wall biosynthesis
MQKTETGSSANNNLSVILPAKNEADTLRVLIPEIRAQFPQAEILVVDDGSTDDTPDLEGIEGLRIVRNSYSMGNGAAIKHGAREAQGDIFLFMDADGQHRPEDAKRLLSVMQETGCDMVVGARNHDSQASAGRSLANRVFNRLASLMTGHRVQDLTSGIRAVNAGKFREFLDLLPNGFSYPTTITMAFFRSGYAVEYEPVTVLKRNGESHIRPLQDGLRFLLIIFRIGSLYSPLKFYLPISAINFLAGCLLYAYSYLTSGRFTNMSALLFTTALLVFLIGMVSEQITNLMYMHKKDS